MNGNTQNTLVFFAAGALIASLAQNVCAQTDAQHSRPLALRTDVKMILVPVTVLDRKGAAVNGLGESSFTVLDDKVPQKIVTFSSEDLPCSIGLVLDVSGSMRNALKPAKEALTQFLGSANPHDEFFLLGISSKPLIYPAGTFGDVEDFTSDTATVADSIQLARLGGSTALVDSVDAALLKMRSARNPRRALVILSDGMDNHSRHSKQELVRLAQEADVQMYTIVINAVPYEKKPIQQVEQRAGLNYLEELADRTGGASIVVQNRHEASDAAAKIGLAIRNQYVIGYRPESADSSGKWHKVEVKLDRERVRVYSRSGYYAH